MLGYGSSYCQDTPVRRMRKACARAALWLGAWSLGTPSICAQPLTVEQITERMVARDQERAESLRSYVGMRRYRVENHRFGKKAEMVVTVRYAYPGVKEFEVVAESGSAAVRKLALRRMIDTERDASREEKLRRETRITPANYDFQLSGSEIVEGRLCFVLRATPKTRNPLLFRGTVWVDGEDFAIVRIEGSPAKSPSFWTRRIHFTHQYRKFGPYWLPVSNHSRTDVLVFGTTETSVEYYDYRINEPVADSARACEPASADREQAEAREAAAPRSAPCRTSCFRDLAVGMPSCAAVAQHRGCRPATAGWTRSCDADL